MQRKRSNAYRQNLALAHDHVQRLEREFRKDIAVLQDLQSLLVVEHRAKGVFGTGAAAGIVDGACVAAHPVETEEVIARDPRDVAAHDAAALHGGVLEARDEDFLAWGVFRCFFQPTT